MRVSRVAIVLFIMLGNIAVWAVANRPASDGAWSGMIRNVSFSPYQPDQDPREGRHPTLEQIDHDLAVLSPHVLAVRTYSTQNGLDAVPELAQRRGLTVTAGAWLDGRPELDDREVEGLIRIARTYPNINRLIVGNEAIMRGDITVEEAIRQIRRVRSEVTVPVSVAETWDIWLAHPELVREVDYMAVHILPYWDGVPAGQAAEYVMMRYRQLRDAYPGVPIVISEVGWPSEGPWRMGAEPSLVNQAMFIRSFLNLAHENQLDYTIIEAFDQPWKRTLEGMAGPSWGIFDAERQPKFSMAGAVQEYADWPIACAIASLLAFPMLLWVMRQRHLHPAGLLFFAILIQVATSVVAWTGLALIHRPLLPSIGIAWSVMIAAQMVLVLAILSDGFEFSEVMWTRHWRRRFTPLPGAAKTRMPKVSIHVPCYNEPPQMVIQTLNRLAQLDYADFEVLVIDNNTRDEAVWRPVEAHCRWLGARFRFFHLPQWPGYKAGALNFALKETAPDAEIVAVIDSDYQVEPNWLSAMVPHFEQPRIGLVQSPQDYRNWRRDGFKSMCHFEYAGFFNIGMIQRNERNAIIQHGTMTLIRRSALDQVGGWAEWCITEDAELGLRLFERGWEAVYCPDSFGRGLIPDTFTDYKTQRFRWAYGAVQILKRHWRDLLPGSRTLTRGQRFHFLSGWLPWFADAANLVFAVAAILWSIGLAFQAPWFGFPPTAFIVPTVAAFLFKLVCNFWLYGARIRSSFTEKLGAAAAGMALSHTVAMAIWQGLFTSGRPFVRTPKCADRPAFVQGVLMARDEIVLMLGLWISAGAILTIFRPSNQEALLWSIMLMVQSLPYIAAVITSMINAIPRLRIRPLPRVAVAKR